MGKEGVKQSFAKHSEGFDLAIIEGVMGLFDGKDPQGLTGSAAEVAQWLASPALMVIDVSGMAGTIRLIESGLSAIEDFPIAGIVANMAGSEGHIRIIEKALSRVPLLGGLTRCDGHRFPERHLGLETVRDVQKIEPALEYWSEKVRNGFDLDRIWQLAQDAPPINIPQSEKKDAPPPCCTIAYAWDEAFHFYYQENLDLLKASGASLVPFSPVHDHSLPPCDGVYLGGGYPEVYGDALAVNQTIREAIRKHHQQGKPIYGECGGLIYLADSLEFEGQQFPMLGILPGKVEVFGKLQALGYCEVESQEDSLLGSKGSKFRGHQFRYSQFHPEDDIETIYKFKRFGKEYHEGYRVGETLASYVHAHWGSNPQIAKNFVQRCVEVRSVH